ncbi:MAG: hypothetical protein HOI95_20745 [Chromatiales bacterium]|nr:hypothetical protein [Chromatiales bacterium]
MDESTDKARSMDPFTAYTAMYGFLEIYVGEVGSDEISGMLGGMQIVGGKTADAAMEEIWFEAVDGAIADRVDIWLKLVR